jgi:uncharacterized protein (DUF2062 family)
MKLFRKIKYVILKISRAHASAHEIAYGAAIGAFISVFPTFGASTLLVIFLYRFMKFNLLAAVSSSMISNFFTAPFFLFLGYKIGAMIRKPESEFNFKTSYKHLDEIGMSLLIGVSILSVLVSILTYFIVKFSVQYFRSRKNKSSITPTVVI